MRSLAMGLALLIEAIIINFGFRISDFGFRILFCVGLSVRDFHSLCVMGFALCSAFSSGHMHSV